VSVLAVSKAVAIVERYNAAAPRSPVLILTTSTKAETKIFPSP